MTGQLSFWPGWETSGLGFALFFQARDPLLLVDPLSELVVDANLAFCQLSGLERVECHHAPLRSFLRHDQGWYDWVRLRQGSPSSHDGFRLHTHLPEPWIPVRLSLSRLDCADLDSMVLVTLQDRRELLDLQRRCQRTDAELRRVVALVSDALWSCLIDAAGKWRFRYLSPAVQQLTGRPTSLFLDDPTAWLLTIEPDDLPAWAKFHDHLRAGSTATLYYRLQHADGTRVAVRESVLATPEDGGLLLTGILTPVDAGNAAVQPLSLETSQENKPPRPLAFPRVPSNACREAESPGESMRTGQFPERVSGNGKVLLADDEDTVRDVASRLLASLGCSVLTARDGEQTLAQFHQHRQSICLAMVDLTMPRLSGEATLRELARLAPDLPLVLMSGFPEMDIRPRLAGLHLAGYLQKPFRLPALADLLRQLLPA